MRREQPPEGPETPDRFTLGVRFGCGALFGFFLPFGFGSFLSFRSGRIALGWCLLAALCTGLAAMRWGDAFWEKGLRGRSWWWW
jgi:hypothetical protein